MKLTVPKTMPRLIKPIVSGLSPFVSTLTTLLTGLWADSVGAWADSTLTWGAHIEYPKRPRIGEIKLKTPTLRHD